MSSEEIMDGFDAVADAPDGVRAHQARYGRDAKERWGETHSYRQSMRRTRGCTKADWTTIQEAGDRTDSRMAGLLAAGADPGGGEAMAAAEATGQHITRCFYPCSYATHPGLAEMYEADLRFTAHDEKRAGGLAGFVPTRSVRMRWAPGMKAGSSRVSRDVPARSFRPADRSGDPEGCSGAEGEHPFPEGDR